jgi:hypothetical protein
MDDEADTPIFYVSAIGCSSLMRRHVGPSSDNLSLAAARFLSSWARLVVVGGS